jgi:hypothetical protein
VSCQDDLRREVNEALSILFGVYDAQRRLAEFILRRVWGGEESPIWEKHRHVWEALLDLSCATGERADRVNELLSVIRCDLIDGIADAA